MCSCCSFDFYFRAVHKALTINLISNSFSSLMCVHLWLTLPFLSSRVKGSIPCFGRKEMQPSLNESAHSVSRKGERKSCGHTRGTKGKSAFFFLFNDVICECCVRQRGRSGKKTLPRFCTMRLRSYAHAQRATHKYCEHGGIDQRRRISGSEPDCVGTSIYLSH